MSRGRGEGTYKQLPDGRWEYRVSLGIGPDGRRQRPRFVAATKADAKALGDEAQRKQRRGGQPLADRARLGDYLEGWLSGLIREPSTVTAYSSRLRLHVIPRLGHVRLGELSPDHLRAWQRDMLKARKSAYIINMSRTILHTALEQAVRDGHLDRNVAALVEPIKYKAEPRVPLNGEQALKLLEQAQGSRYLNLYTVTLGLGMRKGELRGLLRSDVKEGVVEVRRQLRVLRGHYELVDLKTGVHGQRDLPMPAFVAQAIARELDAQRFERQAAGDVWPSDELDLVFRNALGRPLSNYAIDADFKIQLARAGLPDIHFHDLRHSCATLLLSLGVPLRIIQAILGHTSIATTEGYTKVMPELIAEALGRLDDVLGKEAQ